jgi:hypothetical protein
VPLLYADEDQAAAVMGNGDFHKPYAESMGMETSQWRRDRARRWRHGHHRGSMIQTPGHLSDWGYTPPTPQIGTLYQAGLGDAEFDRWSSILDQYVDLIYYINNGGVRDSLAHRANALYPTQQALIKSFAGSPGALDAAKAVVFGKQVKSFRDAVNKARDQYGMLTTKQSVYLLKDAKGGKKAGKINPLWLWIGGGILAAGAVTKAMKLW